VNVSAQSFRISPETIAKQDLIVIDAVQLRQFIN